MEAKIRHLHARAIRLFSEGKKREAIVKLQKAESLPLENLPLGFTNKLALKRAALFSSLCFMEFQKLLNPEEQPKIREKQSALWSYPSFWHEGINTSLLPSMGVAGDLIGGMDCPYTIWYKGSRDTDALVRESSNPLPAIKRIVEKMGCTFLEPVLGTKKGVVLIAYPNSPEKKVSHEKICEKLKLRGVLRAWSKDMKIGFNSKLPRIRITDFGNYNVNLVIAPNEESASQARTVMTSNNLE